MLSCAPPLTLSQLGTCVLCTCTRSKTHIPKRTQHNTPTGSPEAALRLVKLLAFRSSNRYQHCYDRAVTAIADQPGEAGLLASVQQLLRESTAFARVVEDECVRHFKKAATRALSSVQWGARKLEECDVGALSSSRVELAAALMRALLQAKVHPLFDPMLTRT